VTFELVDFPYNGAGVFGVDALKRAISASAEILDAVTPEFDAGGHCADRKDLPIQRGAGDLSQGTQ
jgi:hypothetical protein